MNNCSSLKELLASPENGSALDEFEKNIYQMFSKNVPEDVASTIAKQARLDLQRGLNIFADTFDDLLSKITGNCDVVKVAAVRCAAQHIIGTCDGVGKQFNDYDHFCNLYSEFANNCISTASVAIDTSYLKNKEGKADGTNENT